MRSLRWLILAVVVIPLWADDGTPSGIGVVKNSRNEIEVRSLDKSAGSGLHRGDLIRSFNGEHPQIGNGGEYELLIPRGQAAVLVEFVRPSDGPFLQTTSVTAPRNKRAAAAMEHELVTPAATPAIAATSSEPDSGLTAAVWMVIVVCAFLYFVPSFYAAMRKHRNRDAIFVLNLLLGWTVLGWIAAAVWSATANVATEPSATATNT